ncbi:hypothetical protein KI387_031401, partial [Taxus chinensis]
MTQSTTPQTMRKSPKLSPQKETTAKRRRKFNFNEEVEESKESAPNSPTPLENVEEQKDEEMKQGEEKEKGIDEIVTETNQDMEAQVPNLGIQ